MRLFCFYFGDIKNITLGVGFLVLRFYGIWFAMLVLSVACGGFVEQVDGVEIFVHYLCRGGVRYILIYYDVHICDMYSCTGISSA